ncbi:hypothetical protein [Parafrankia elaeagni]|uniref:hypothetical protein n=1 Tax=Parafrankia elaeagni TaxID=222534 RepID=UPI0003A4CE42|nr:hypothetical protein [Parafrankia elaeagni]
MVVAAGGLIALGLVVAAGVVLERRHSEYGEFFPGRFPERLTYCDGRGYLRGSPEARAEIDLELVAAGRTPGGATIFRSKDLAVVAGGTLCTTIIWAGDPDDTHLVHYTLLGGP